MMVRAIPSQRRGVQMPREVQYVAPTPRKKINRKEATKIFLAHNGMCCNCGRQISVTEDWFIEHVDALILGGGEVTDNRRPSHVKNCKAEKDAADAAARSERDRIVTKNWQRDDETPHRGFRRALPQKRATTPLTKGVGLAYFTEDTQP